MIYSIQLYVWNISFALCTLTSLTRIMKIVHHCHEQGESQEVILGLEFKVMVKQLKQTEEGIGMDSKIRWPPSHRSGT